MTIISQIKQPKRDPSATLAQGWEKSQALRSSLSIVRVWIISIGVKDVIPKGRAGQGLQEATREKARWHLEEDFGQWYHQKIKRDQETWTLNGAPSESHLENYTGYKKQQLK